jgi:hypothetical protein
MGSALRGPASAIATPSDATLLMTLTTLREGTRSSAVRDLPARYPTRAAFGEPLKSGALLGRRIKYQSFDVLNRAAGFAAARHGRAAPVSGSDAVGGANLILVEGIAPGVLALRLRVAPDLPARRGARRPSAQC